MNLNLALRADFGKKRHDLRLQSDVSNGQSKFGGDTMRRSRDIRASGSECDRQEIASSWEKSGRRPQSHFDENEFGVREPNSAEIRLAVFEKRSYRRTHRQTDRQTSLLYIYRYKYNISRRQLHDKRERLASIAKFVFLSFTTHDFLPSAKEG